MTDNRILCFLRRWFSRRDKPLLPHEQIEKVRRESFDRLNEALDDLNRKLADSKTHDRIDP